MITVYCNDRKAWLGDRETLTAGSLGQEVEFSFSDEWLNLQKYAVFVAYGTSITKPLIEDKVSIPQDVFQLPGIHLFVGVYGVNLAGTTIIPTLYCDLGMIHPGADPAASDNYETPTATMLAEMLALTKAAQLAASIATGGAIAGNVVFSIQDHKDLIATVQEEDAEPTVLNLGPVTAYGDAVAGGSEETYEQFQEKMLRAYNYDARLTDIETRLDDMEDRLDNIEAAIAPGPEPEPEPTPTPSTVYVTSTFGGYQQAQTISHSAIKTSSILGLAPADGISADEKLAYYNASLNLQNLRTGSVLVVAGNPQRVSFKFKLTITNRT